MSWASFGSDPGDGVPLDFSPLFHDTSIAKQFTALLAHTGGLRDAGAVDVAAVLPQTYRRKTKAPPRPSSGTHVRADRRANDRSEEHQRPREA